MFDYFPSPGWYRYGTKEYLEKQIGNGFQLKIGWTVFDYGAFLILQPEHAINFYRLYFWNNPKTKEQLQNLLNL